ncbi:unnamed protein product, partial [Closterium sp. NIES-54]
VLFAATVAPPSLRGVPLSPFFPLLLMLLLSTSLALKRSELRLPLVGDAATARARGSRVVEGAAGEAVEEVEEAEEVAVEVGVVPGVGASVAAVELVTAVAEMVEAAAAVLEVAAAVVLVEVQPRSVEALVAASASSSCAPLRPRWPTSFNVAIFDLDFDAILAAIHAFADSAQGDSYLSVPPDPGIAAAALGASASAAPCSGASAAPSAGASALSVSASSQVAASSQVFAAASKSSPASAPCSCRPLSHENLLWHHRLGHPSLPRLRGMASRALVSGLPWFVPPLLPGPAPTCVPCVEGRQRAAPHSSSFPPIEALLQTLHMDVWAPARVRGQGHERYFLLVVDDKSRYTTVFPLRSKGEVPEVLINWIRSARRQLSESFGSNLPVLRLHSDRGGEFSSDLLRAFCRSEGIRQTLTLPASPQQNGIAERRIGMDMDINLQPRVSLLETTPTLRWTGKVGDASAFRVWGSRAFVHDTTADKLSSRAVPCVFLGFSPDAPGWQFFHPISRRVLSSQDVTFDESVCYYRLFPYRTASPPPRRSSYNQVLP